MTTFILKISFGNDAMQTAGDIAEKLKEISEDIAAGGLDIGGKRIFDLNGNSVGFWRVR